MNSSGNEILRSGNHPSFLTASSFSLRRPSHCVVLLTASSFSLRCPSSLFPSCHCVALPRCIALCHCGSAALPLPTALRDPRDRLLRWREPREKQQKRVGGPMGGGGPRARPEAAAAAAAAARTRQWWWSRMTSFRCACEPGWVAGWLAAAVTWRELTVGSDSPRGRVALALWPCGHTSLWPWLHRTLCIAQ